MTPNSLHSGSTVFYRRTLCLLAGVLCWTAAFCWQTPEQSRVLAEAQRKIDSIMKDPKLRQYMNKSNPPNGKGGTPSVPTLPSDVAAMAANPMAFLAGPKKPDTAFLSGIKIPPRDNKAIGSIPATPTTRSQMASHLANLKKNILAAMTSTGLQVISMSGTDDETIDNASVIAWVSNHPEQALQLALQAANLNPDNDNALNNLSTFLTICGLPTEAVPILDFIRQEDPSNSTINNNLGQAWLQLGDAQKATGYLQQALADNPDHPHANYALAYIALAQGDKNRAATYCENAIHGAYVADAWRMLKSIKPDARLMELIKKRYKQTDYFSPHKYPLLPQCREVKDVKELTIKYAEYKNMLMDSRQKYDRMMQVESKYVEKNLANEVMAQVHNGQNPLRPFSALAMAVIGDLGEDLSDRLKKLNDVDSNYFRKMRELTQDHDEQIKIVAKSFDKRADAAGEGNPDMELESDECKAINAVHNKYLPQFAELTEEWQRQWIQQTKDYFNDYAYWCYFASMDDHSYHKAFYSLIEQYIAQIMKLNRTTLLSCHLPVTYDKNEADSLEIAEGKCPLSSKIDVGLSEVDEKTGKPKFDKFASFDIDCEQFKVDFELPEGASLSYRHSAAGSNTIAIGAGMDAGKSKHKVIKMLPISATMGAFISFGGNEPFDIGFKWEGTLNLPGWLGGKNTAGYSFSMNHMWETHGKGKLVDAANAWVDRYEGIQPAAPQLNKNIKMYDNKSH
ncbi:MAG: tetratricopeptide repeat protein [Bacteroidota bacterium]|nr:tetratricopeptide repeat protein [Bacteroidota bacterium]MDP4216405.1 tetratricopeptide repeat protein [Bacteroidota bacterium]